MVIDKRHLMIAVGVLLTIIISIVAYLWFTHMVAPKELPKVLPVKLQSTTEVTVVPKTSPTDNDIEITQTYRAAINGAKVEIPVVTKDNVKGVVKQEIDLTPVLQMQKALDKKEFKKNWEISVGVGIHEGDIYVPVEVQRNYAVDKAISAEVHIKADVKPKVNGAEVKHTWMF